LGHRKRLEIIDRQIKENKMNLSLIGASYQGFSVPDCIYNSKLTAQTFAKSIGVV
jgi:protoporphyrinogen oxidase